MALAAIRYFMVRILKAPIRLAFDEPEADPLRVANPVTR